MIIAVDIGNTTIASAIVADGRIVARRSLLTSSRSSSDDLVDFYVNFLKLESISPTRIVSSAVSCVVPDVLESVVTALEKLLQKPCFLVRPGIRIGMKVWYNPPESIGADRIVNAFAVRAKWGFPSICIDFGTATTFSVLNGNGDFYGGIIIPGFRSFSEILPKTTALLPQPVVSQPVNAIGHSTRENLQSGLFFGYLDMLDGLIRRIEAEISGKPKVIATGGYSGLFETQPGLIDFFDSDLIFKGIELLYRFNQRSDSSYVW